MKYYQLLAAVVGLFSLAVATHAQDKQPDENKFDAARMVGKWKFDSGKKAGEPSQAAGLEGGVSISDKEFTMPTEAGAFVMAYKVDNSHSPAHIELEITGGPVPEGEARGIIGMKDGKLMLCYHPMGGERPAAFESTEENGNFLFVMSKDAGGPTIDDLVGSWNYHSGQRAGEDVDADRLVGEVVITKKTFTLPGGGENFVMAYKLDSTASPAKIDFEIEAGPVPEGQANGIIKLDGKKIVLCYNPMGETRPESFETSEDNGFFMFVLKRAEDE